MNLNLMSSEQHPYNEEKTPNLIVFDHKDNTELESISSDQLDNLSNKTREQNTIETESIDSNSHSAYEIRQTIKDKENEGESGSSHVSQETEEHFGDEAWQKAQQARLEADNAVNKVRHWGRRFSEEELNNLVLEEQNQWKNRVAETTIRSEVQEDILKDWFGENSDLSLSFSEPVWAVQKEALSESIKEDRSPDSKALPIFDQVKNRVQDSNTLLNQVNELVSKVQSKGFHVSDKEETLRWSDHESLVQQWAQLPEDIQASTRDALEEVYEEAKRKKNQWRPIYEKMREAVSLMGKVEEPSLEVGVGHVSPLPFNLSAMKSLGATLSALTEELQDLGDEDRVALFHQVDEDLIEEQESLGEQKTGWGLPLERSIGRSASRLFYGLHGIVNGAEATISDWLAKGAEQIGGEDMANTLKKHAERLRQGVTTMEQLRELSEERAHPLRKSLDGRGAQIEQGLLKDCLLGVGEEALPIALGVAYPPALLGYGVTTIGNQYAKSETKALREQEGKSLAHHSSRIASALAFGALQTLLEAGAYTRLFKPLTHHLPKVGRVVDTVLRPYLEQKAMSLVEPTEEVVENYLGDMIDQDHHVATFHGEKLKERIGGGSENLQEYVMTLPFVLLATGKVVLSQFRSSKALLSNSILETKFGIPKDLIATIREEPDLVKRNVLLREALQKSKAWEDPLLLQQSARLLDESEYGREVSKAQWYSTSTLKKLLGADVESLEKLSKNKGKPFPKYNERENVFAPRPQSYSFLEQKQAEWHAIGKLPSLMPEMTQVGIRWRFEQGGEPFKMYTSPIDALKKWGNQRAGDFYEKRMGAYSSVDFYDYSKLLSRQSEDAVDWLSKSNDELKSLEARLLLWNSKFSFVKNLNKQELNKWQLDTRECLKKQIIEDAERYAQQETYPREIVQDRLTQMWIQKLKSGMISMNEAQEWVRNWEKFSHENLEGYCSNNRLKDDVHSKLGAQLAEIGMNYELSKFSKYLPPSFSEPTKQTIDALFFAHQWQGYVRLTPSYYGRSGSFFYNSEAFGESMESYFACSPTEVRSKYQLFSFKASRESVPSRVQQEYLFYRPDEELMNDVAWLTKRGTPPIISRYYPQTGETSWFALYKDGGTSQRYMSPLQAARDWRVYNRYIYGSKFDHLSRAATDDYAALYTSHDKMSPWGIILDVKDQYEPELTMESALRSKIADRMFDAGHLKGREKTIDKRSNQVMSDVTKGRNYQQENEHGYVYSHVETYDKKEPFALIEEYSEALWLKALANKAMSEEDVLQQIRMIESKNNVHYLGNDFDFLKPHERYYTMIEALSSIGNEWIFGQKYNRHLPITMREWIKTVESLPEIPSVHVSHVRNSLPTVKALRQKDISPHFKQLLWDGLGLDTVRNAERVYIANHSHKYERAKAFGYLDNPEKSWEIMSTPVQNRLSEELNKVSNKTTFGALSLVYTRTGDNPKLRLYDYEPKTNKFYAFSISEGSLIELENDKLEKFLPTEDQRECVKILGVIRRSMDGAPVVTPKGIQWGRRLFNTDSSDCPVGTPKDWRVQRDEENFEGLRYWYRRKNDRYMELRSGSTFIPHAKLQNPYVRFVEKGGYVSSSGDIKSPFSIETYIPLEELENVVKNRKDGVAIRAFDYKEALEMMVDTERLHEALYTGSRGEYVTGKELRNFLFEVQNQYKFSLSGKQALSQLFEEISSSEADLKRVKPINYEKIKSLADHVLRSIQRRK